MLERLQRVKLSEEILLRLNCNIKCNTAGP